MQKNRPQIGGHLVAAQGLPNVVLAARSLRYDIVQIMLGGNTDWSPYSITNNLAEQYKTMMYGLGTYVHLPYVVNPCVEAGRRRNFCKATIKKYAKVAESLGVRAMILHPGFRQERTEEEAYQNARTFLQEILKDGDFRPKILLETDAGSKNGSAVGSIEFIESLLHELRDDRLGICLDTCHLYARGTNLWEKAVRERFLEDHGEKVELIHFNVPDPDVELGSHRDRHNSPISSFGLDSDPLILRLGRVWPLLLERRSIAVQREDADHIRQVLKTDDSNERDGEVSREEEG